MNRIVLLCCFLALGQPATGVAADREASRGPACGEEPRLSEYLETTALNNPELEAAFYRWRAALERVPQVSSLPDPRITFAYFIREVETRVGPQNYRVGLMQTLPWPGKLKLKEEQALAEARAAESRFHALKWRIYAQVKEAYFEYAYLSEAVRIAQESLTLMEHLAQTVLDRYSAGEAQYVDVVDVSLRLGIVSDRHRTLQDLRGPHAARLNAFMNRPLEDSLPWPDHVPLLIVESTLDELKALLPIANPDLDALEHMVAAADKARAAAEREYYPDVTLGIETISTGEARGGPVTPPDSGKDAVIASVNLNIPIWIAGRSAAVREAGHRRTAVLMEHASRTSTLGADLEMIHYEYRDAARRAELYGNVLSPQARQGLEVTLEAFRSGNRNAGDLVAAENTLLEFELARVRALADQAVRAARLERLLAMDVSGCDSEDRR